jgi:hypothetical protein
MSNQSQSVPVEQASPITQDSFEDAMRAYFNDQKLADAVYSLPVEIREDVLANCESHAEWLRSLSRENYSKARKVESALLAGGFKGETSGMVSRFHAITDSLEVLAQDTSGFIPKGQVNDPVSGLAKSILRIGRSLSDKLAIIKRQLGM